MSRFLGNPKVQYLNSSGQPYSGGLLYVYDAGTTNAKDSFPTLADALAKTNANANPVVLDSAGMASVVIAGNCKLVLKDSAGNTIWTQDNVNEDATILDANGNEFVKYTTTASAVNEITITNAATGTGPTIAATGGDTNIDLTLQTKGTGVVTMKGAAATAGGFRIYEGTNNGTNYTQISAAASIASNYSIILPTTDGTNGQVLQTNGSGQLSYVSVTATASIVQQNVTVAYSAHDSGSTSIPVDDTIPQNTEGTQLFTLAITPGNSANYLIFSGLLQASCTTFGTIAIAIFQDSTADAIWGNVFACSIANSAIAIPISFRMTAGTTSSTTFSLRIGTNVGIWYTNDYGGSPTLGGVMISRMNIMEVTG